ncbi:site-specific recombinase [Xylophilus sp. GOD-11R]|uniref:site-specific recombinase n=1 Tax=Xylophilus sp. GOD-11R TaxID=3089814 RepID=UPI00298BDC47|nr:site-specific recombinase [Xylophilus sp. GOD-11R]WPB57274.1 site-specific recombinase [Xylophilus sp. GOD-11R]
MSKRDLQSLLDTIDPQAPLADRHLWLIGLFEWIRGKSSNPQAAVSRVQLLLDALATQPSARLRLALWWHELVESVDATPLLADFGFAPRTAFFSEFADRMRRKLLPASPETVDSAELFPLALPEAFDAQWIAALDQHQLARIADLLSPPDLARLDGGTAVPVVVASPWQHTLLDAITYCAGQVVATGFSPELRLRMGDAARLARPFQGVMMDVEWLRMEVLRRPRDGEALAAAVHQLRERLDACRQAANSVYAHLEENGISVGLVFRLRQLRARLLRIRELLDCVLSESPPQAAARLLARLVLVGQERRSVRALVAANSSLLAAKVAERSAETGEHYITRDADSYRRMLRQAAGGGVLTAGTVIGKFCLVLLGLSAFWGGVWSSVLYAGSFVLIQLLHCTLATKQPAMTAPAMAARLRQIENQAGVERFVDEVTHLVRSQVAAVLGNVLTVFPVMLVLAWSIQAVSGQPLVRPAEAAHTLASLNVLGPTMFFAAFTGVLLFAASIIAGWAENWFVLHHLESAMRFNPAIIRVLGQARAARWAHFMREHISGFASNISLGVMLGMVPPLLAFVGVGLEARHVTLSTGQIAGAAVTYGLASVHMPAFWMCIAAIPLIGALNLTVSFALAFQLALRAQNVGSPARARIRGAIWRRLLRRPLTFFLPLGRDKSSAAPVPAATETLPPAAPSVPEAATTEPPPATEPAPPRKTAPAERIDPH